MRLDVLTGQLLHVGSQDRHSLAALEAIEADQQGDAAMGFIGRTCGFREDIVGVALRAAGYEFSGHGVENSRRFAFGLRGLAGREIR